MCLQYIFIRFPPPHRSPSFPLSPLEQFQQVSFFYFHVCIKLDPSMLCTKQMNHERIFFQPLLKEMSKSVLQSSPLHNQANLSLRLQPPMGYRDMKSMNKQLW
jgi:hypothetical protein